MAEQKTSFRIVANPGSARLDAMSAISPGLALVDPIAAAAARAALPDRPWEQALDRAIDPLGQSVAAVTRPITSAPTHSSPAYVHSVRRGRVRFASDVRRRLAFMAAGAVAVTGLALLAEVRPVEAPGFARPHANGLGRQAQLPTPVAGGGYVIGPRSGFRVGPQGRAIGQFTVPVKCLWGVPLGRVAVHRDMTFSLGRTVRGTSGRAVGVWVSGHFTGPRAAVGSVTVRGPGCIRNSITFVARLS